MFPYPRPDFVRNHWESLNGQWEFAFDDANVGLEAQWHLSTKPLDRSITVPYVYQSELSGIGDITIHPLVWYAREFVVPDAWLEGDVLLNFGAVDYRCQVWLNGKEVGRNQGGHVPFSFNVRPYLTSGVNRLVLRVEDPQDNHQPRGKQSHTGLPHGIDYRCTTGIWQSVWLEPVSHFRIDSVQMVATVGKGADSRLRVNTLIHAPAGHHSVEVEISLQGEVLAKGVAAAANGATEHEFVLPNAPKWSPESPSLIDVVLRLREGDAVLDEVRTYTGLRTVETRDGEVFLNGEPIYLQMILDQGYWPDGIMTATDDQLRLDVELTKAMGFNGARKHQKMEDPRWLYWCDRLGLLVWGEMANARDWNIDSAEALATEWQRAVVRDRNHPSIIAWVPLNESWGVPKLTEEPQQIAYLEHLVAITKRLDPTRPVIDNDGWEHCDFGDIAAIHDYTGLGQDLYNRWIGGMPERIWGSGNLANYVGGAKHRGQPIILSEIGGYLFIPAGKEIKDMDGLYTAYDTHRSVEELEAKYAQLVAAIAKLPNVAGYCYTQLTDIQPELNGLLLEDRTPKLPVERLREINEAALASHRSVLGR